MKIKYKTVLLGSLITLLLSGCFDIQETLQMNADGSGTMTFTADVTYLKAINAVYAKMDEDEYSETQHPFDLGYLPEDVDHEVQSAADDMNNALKTRLQGMVLKAPAYNKTTNLLTIQFAFKNADQLDSIYRFMALELGGIEPNGDSAVFINKGNTLVRSSNFYYLNPVVGKDEDILEFLKEKQESAAETDTIFEKANYRLICNFDRKIKTISNPAYRLGANDKSCTVKMNIVAMLANSSSPATLITFK